MKKNNNLNHSLLNTFIISLAALLSGTTWAAQSYHIPNGSSQSINEFGVCHKVTNNSGSNLFVSTNSSTGWASFYNNSHVGVTLDTCVIPITGYSCSIPTDSGNDTNGPCYTSWLDVCALIPGLSNGQTFTIKTDVTGSNWVVAPNTEIRTYTFTKGTAYTDSISSPPDKANTNKRIYDGNCLVRGSSQFGTNNTSFNAVAIAITELSP